MLFQRIPNAQRLKYCLIPLLLLLCSCGPGGPDQQGLLDKALEQAKAENKPVLIDFYTTWCPPCKAFTRDSSSKEAIKAALNQVILVKIDCEAGNGATLAQQYEVTQYPTFVLIKPNGEILDTWIGYHERMFVGSFNQAMAGWKP